MKRTIGLFFLVGLLLLAGGFGIQRVYGAQTQETVLQKAPTDPHYKLMQGISLSAQTKLDLWHHSGGYWRVGNAGSEKITLTDRQVGKGLSQLIPTEQAAFTLPLPQAVQDKLKEGSRVVARVEANSGAALEDLFVMETLQSQMEGDILTFLATPKFNLISGDIASFQDHYKLNLETPIPFIEAKYGYNTYSLFGKGARGLQANGWVNPSDPKSLSGMPGGRIHPTMILNTTGKLKAGYRIQVGGAFGDSGDYQIGEGTFSDAGACGLCFVFPVRFTFYEYIEELPPIEPPEPGKSLCEACHVCELKEGTICSAAACPCWETEACGCYVAPQIEGVAGLSLPQVTYEGHPALAQDQSTFIVEGEPYSATRAYEEGMARNRFAIEESGGGSVSRLPDSKVKAEATFPNRGSYHVNLKVYPKGGGSLLDTKPITVLKTPTILHTLTGVQKQNRKQVLTIRVATYPKSPLETLYVELENIKTGEKVRLNHNLSFGTNALENTEHIKTRAIQRQPSDAYFTRCELWFLTKNGETADYRYTVYAKDTRGFWDEVSADFSVVPDQAPLADIATQTTFLREAGSNTATLTCSDTSTTDGDQLTRSWSAAFFRPEEGGEGRKPGMDSDASPVYVPLEALPGYGDASFGSGKSVHFQKTGVGPVELRLLVRDRWSEETLPEYISESDYLTAAAVKRTQVGNVAPVVSLTPIESKTAGVLLLAGGEEEYQTLSAGKNAMQELLLQQGVDASLAVAKLAPLASDMEPGDPQHLQRLWEAVTPYGYQGTWSGFFENGNYCMDEEKIYKVDATWKGSELRFYPELPYTIRAYEGLTGKVVWTYTLTADVLVPENQSRGAYLTGDEQGKYLYYCDGGKTLILDKKDGTLLTVLPFSVGTQNTLCGPYLFSVKEDGIYRIDTENGAIRRIFTGRISGACRLLEGKLHFLTVDGLTINRGVFDPVSTKTVLERLTGTETDDGRTGYTAVGIDSRGRILVRGLVDNGSLASPFHVRAYDVKGKLIKKLSFTAGRSRDAHITPIYDEGGRCRYVAWTYDGNGSTYDYGYAYVYGLDDGYFGGDSVRSKDGYPTVTSQIVFAGQLGSRVQLVTGANWNWMYDQAYGGSWCGYPERAKAFSFDVKNGGASEVELTAVMNINSTEEYGQRGSVFAATQIGDNNQYGGASTLTAWTWKQSMEDILLRKVGQLQKTDLDFSAVLLYDNQNRVPLGTRAAITARLNRQNTRFLYATKLVGEDTYGLRLAEALGVRGSVLAGGETLPVAAAKKLLEKPKGGDFSLLLETKPGGSLTKSFALQPDTKYFYEYDLKPMEQKAAGALPKAEDILTVKPRYQKAVDDSLLLPDRRYWVTDCFTEDFNDSQINPYFSLQPGRVGSGVYRGANRTDRVSSKNNHFYTDGSTLYFQVPEGKQAAVSFDYDIRMDGTQQWMSNGVWIGDGELTKDPTTGAESLRILRESPWEELVSGSQSGHYTHRHLLSPGVHTLSFRAWTYGRRDLSTWTHIDNLRVALVAEQNGQQAVSPSEGGTVTPLSNGWSRIKGSFDSPNSVASFTGQRAEYIRGAFGSHPYIRRSSDEAGRKEVALILPSGKIAVFAGIDTWSSPGGSQSRPQSVVFQWGGYQWRCTRDNRYPERAMNNIPGSYRISLANVGGTQTFIQRSSAYRGAYGDYSGAELLVLDSDKTNVLTNGKRYFMAAMEGETLPGLFVENETFDGTTDLGFAPSVPGKYQLQNLKLYSIQNGVKVYAVQEEWRENGALLPWSVTKGAATILADVSDKEDEEAGLIYKKGELVSYGIHYYDYERDPSKRQFWRYTHTPFNDGPHPDAAVILDENSTPSAITGKVLSAPINRFYIDGKYTVEHWQEDNTKRLPPDFAKADPKGYPAYDRVSNVESLTFYIEGGASAPWITHIKTLPSTVKEGQPYRIRIGVDDREKDVLSVTAELYREKKLIYTYGQTGLAADQTGAYPLCLTGFVPKAMDGRYEIVATVRDQRGVGVASYRFTVVSDGKVTGFVNHTDQWDQNRKTYNVGRFGEEVNRSLSYADYLAMKEPRRRGTNVFWSGERFELSAGVLGSPTKVTCAIKETKYTATLHSTGKKNALGETLYGGELWDQTMINRWGRKTPKELSFQFTATYSGGTKKTHEVKIIVDSREDYWQLHRHF